MADYIFVPTNHGRLYICTNQSCQMIYLYQPIMADDIFVSTNHGRLYICINHSWQIIYLYQPITWYTKYNSSLLLYVF